MALEMTLPELGENIDSATVVNVLVHAGDKITENQSIVEVDTEKAAVEVPASAAGTVSEIRVKQGDVVKVGQVLLTLEEAGKPAEPAAPSAPPPPAPSPQPPEQPTAPAPQERTQGAPPPSAPICAGGNRQTNGAR
jgi:pyruvate/2-oxoglutarate dehydrogenase complex dihydrolipoamide acyltransferase (E2) component